LQEISTNDIAELKPGQCLRSFLLDKKGELIDDVSIFYLGQDDRNIDVYLMETNPQNTEKVKLWFEDDIFAKIEGPVVVEDLKEEVKEKSRKTVIALYGPDSSKVLEKIEPSLNGLKRFCFLEKEIKGVRGIISRSDYTEGDPKFKFYIHPDDASTFWNLLLEEGKGFEISPAGLLVRSQLRSEANLPSYGMDPLCIEPILVIFIYQSVILLDKK